MRQSSQKTQIGDLELASIAPKYGPYLALPAGPEPAVRRLAPKTGQRAAVAGNAPEPAFPLMWEPGAATGQFSADKHRYPATAN